MKKILTTLIAASILFLTGCSPIEGQKEDSDSRIKRCEAFGGIARKDFRTMGNLYSGCDFPVRVLIVDAEGATSLLEQPQISNPQ